MCVQLCDLSVNEYVHSILDFQCGESEIGDVENRSLYNIHNTHAVHMYICASNLVQIEFRPECHTTNQPIIDH